MIAKVHPTLTGYAAALFWGTKRTLMVHTQAVFAHETYHINKYENFTTRIWQAIGTMTTFLLSLATALVTIEHRVKNDDVSFSYPIDAIIILLRTRI